MAASETIQTISRLTPLADVLVTVDAEVKPVTQRTIDVSAATGRALATDVSAPARPASALALHDGWALTADETLGAGGYAPSPLVRAPPRVEAGQALPTGTDSVAPIDAVKITGGLAEALVPINPGEGVLAAGGDSDPAIPLRYAGERLRATDLSVFSAAGVARVTVREPRIRVLPVRGTGIISAAARLITADIERRGGAARLDESGRGLDVAMAAESADAIVAIGGTGSGRNDNSVQILARDGRVAVHGIALTPGETAAFGFVGVAAGAAAAGTARCRARRLAHARTAHAGAARRRPRAERTSRSKACRWRARSRRPSGFAEVVPVRRSGGAGRAVGHANICRCRRWRAPTAGSWCRPTAKAIPPAPAFR